MPSFIYNFLAEKMETKTSPGHTFTRVPITENLSVLDRIVLVLMILGAINWGFVGLANFDVVAFLFGTMSPVSRVVYGLIGLAGIYGIPVVLHLRRRT